MGYDEVTFLADRVCSICGYAHSVAYANSVENALGIEVPLSSQAVRAVLLETERLQSHPQLGLATATSSASTPASCSSSASARRR